MSIAHEWGRFVWWLNVNSGAIQALSSVVTAAVTLYLVGFNRRAVEAAEKSHRAAQAQFNLGQEQFELARREVAAQFKPILNCSFTTGMQGTSHVRGVTRHLQHGTVLIVNYGNAPLKLLAVAVLVRKAKEDGTREYEVMVEALGDRVIFAGKKFEGDIDVEVKDALDVSATFGLRVQCSDLSGISSTCYTWYPKEGIREVAA